jgi:hypothetical protein
MTKPNSSREDQKADLESSILDNSRADVTIATQGKYVDKITEAAIYQGVNMTQICLIFKKDIRDVKAKLNGNVNPVGTRSGANIYAIREVAPYLVPPPYDMDEFIQKMALADLPMMLRKEYWAALRSKQLYQIDAAELWETSAVIDIVSELLKTVRMAILPIREAVERQSVLTQQQRTIITNIIDNTLEKAYATASERFGRELTNSPGTDLNQSGSTEL